MGCWGSPGPPPTCPVRSRSKSGGCGISGGAARCGPGGGGAMRGPALPSADTPRHRRRSPAVCRSTEPRHGIDPDAQGPRRSPQGWREAPGRWAARRATESRARRKDAEFGSKAPHEIPCG